MFKFFFNRIELHYYLNGIVLVAVVLASVLVVSCESNLPEPPVSAVVHGTVFDPIGRPLKNKQVSISRVSVYNAITDENGHFEIDLGDISAYRQRYYSLSVDVDGYELFEYGFFFKGNGEQQIDAHLSPIDGDEWVDLPKFQFGGYTYWVYDDIGAMTWYEASRRCKDMVDFGKDDWKLPSKNELNAMYLRKDLIGGWDEAGYWCATTDNFDLANYQVFDESGEQGYGEKEWIGKVRPIRRKK